MPPQILIPKYSTSKGLECFAKQIIKRASANSSDIQNLSKFSTINDEKEIPIAHKRDLIGPAHPISNIRDVRLHKPINETNLHKRYRLLRQDTLEWHHQFWITHNTEFAEKKEEYVKKVLTERYPNDVSKTSLNAEEMSEFYKDFLDQKWSSHIKYNLEWQKRNFTLIFLSILVGAEKIKHKIY